MEQKQNRVMRTLARLGFEILTIIAGISIALFVNNIQERRHDKEILTSTLNSLSKEFNKNIENINKLHPILTRFQDTLKFYENKANISIYDLTFKAPHLSTAELYTTNWRATLSSNSLHLIDFETVTLLSQIDAKHQELRDQATTLNSIIYSPAIYKRDGDGVSYRKVLGDWLGSYIGNEKELIDLYRQFDALISNK